MITRLATAAAILWAAVVGCLEVANIVRPARNGPMGLARVFAPYLRLPLVPAALVLWRRTALGLIPRVLLAVCTILVGVRSLRGRLAMPRKPSPGSLVIGVTSWNLRLGLADPDRILDGLRSAGPGLIGLVELTTRHADTIAADPGLLRRFPYRSLHPRDGSTGSGLLSSYPFLESPALHLVPPMLKARIDLGTGRGATVVVVHPWAPVIGRDAGGPSLMGYDATSRDTQIRAIRAAVDPPLSEGEPVLVFGDLNTTDREPGYLDLVRGLTDAHRAVGSGPGATWRPPRMQRLPLGLLRIDMLLTGGAARPLSITTDCTSRASDHCILRATVEISPGHR